jgi:molybdopterin-guanine dinucleotide biosynthesis protein A
VTKLSKDINVLILVGGKSSRMGTDKSKLVYYNIPQIDYVFNLVKQVIPKQNIYFSVRDKHQLENKSQITDIYPNLGPFGAIYSAFEFDSSKSWLVLAIDLPYFNINLLKLLIKNRTIDSIATTFQGKAKKYPEPLITIWETKVIPLLKKGIENKTYSLVKILKNNSVNIIPIEDDLIQNINTKEAYEKVRINLNKTKI